MALFNLLGGGISFNNDVRSGTRDLVDSKYKTKLLRYPSDLGSADKGHYMVININEQINTSFPGKQTGDNTAFAINKEVLTKDFGGYDAVSGFKVLNNLLPDFFKNISPLSQVSKRIDSAVGIRTVRRITDCIALYIPDTLTFSHNQSYSKISTSSGKLSGLTSAAETYKENGNSFDVANQLSSASPFLVNSFLKKFGDIGRVLFTAGTGGKVENPMMEILYSSPEFRSFRFDFLMMPRSESEAKEVQDIINLLKFHQAPELVRNSGGLFLYPPSEFDISFYYNGAENINIPKISTCVLSSIDTDYAPGGFATYEVEGEPQPIKGQLGRTGMPVAIRLSLSFTETEYLVKGSPLLPSDRKMEIPTSSGSARAEGAVGGA